MTKTYTVYSDLHLGHKTEIKIPFKFSKNTVFLGDNFDIVNVPRKNLKKIKNLRSETIQKCLQKGGTYLSGNHSLTSLNQINLLQKKEENILFIHGDVINWGYFRARLYRNLLFPSIGELRQIFFKNLKKPYKSKLNATHLKRAHKLALLNNCKIIVFGHFHPQKLIQKEFRGVKIIIVPRGKTILKL